MPDISAIVATKNSARFLAEALASIRGQQGVSIDLIVVDARSTDGTVAIAREFGARIIEQAEGNLADAWNLGIQAAQAAIIGILDSDDRWAPGTLARRLAAIRETPGARISLGSVRMFREPGTPRPPELRADIFDRAFPAPIPGTLLVAKEVFETIGLFDSSYVIAADGDWIGRAYDAGYKPVMVDEVVLEKRFHGGNLSYQPEVSKAELLRGLRAKIVRARQSAT